VISSHWLPHLPKTTKSGYTKSMMQARMLFQFVKTLFDRFTSGGGWDTKPLDTITGISHQARVQVRSSKRMALDNQPILSQSYLLSNVAALDPTLPRMWRRQVSRVGRQPWSHKYPATVMLVCLFVDKACTWAICFVHMNSTDIMDNIIVAHL